MIVILYYVFSYWSTRLVNEFQNNHWCAVTTTRHGLQNPRVTTLTVSILWSKFFKQVLKSRLNPNVVAVFLNVSNDVPDVGSSLTPGCKITMLSKRDHLISSLTNFLSPCFGSGNLTINN